MNPMLKIGWAQVDITPDRPVFVAGQMYPRLSSYVHDPLTATCLVLENGQDQVVFVSLDMVTVPKACCDRFRERLKDVPGLDVEKIAFHATHTHNSLRGAEDPHLDRFARFLGADRVEPFDLPEDVLYGQAEIDFLADHVNSLVRQAWAARQPGGIAAAEDYAVVAFNRRPVFQQEDGTWRSQMYGACSRDDFVRMEGPSDHRVNMLYTFDSQQQLTGVLVDVPCPAQVYELHAFLSADYWCDVRDCLREHFGPLYVLAACGAGGDQNPIDLISISRHNEQALADWSSQAGEVFRNFDMKEACRQIGERVAEAVLRGYRRAIRTIDSQPALTHRLLELSLPIRTVSREETQQARQTVDALKAAYGPDNKMDLAAQVKAYEAIGVLLRWERQHTEPDYTFTCHIIRIGQVALVTNPFELFTEYGLQIRARSRSEQVFVIQLCDDAGVYLPTQAAIEGGSYSSKPATTLLGPDQGQVLVRENLRAIKSLW